jgi:hypothetical protein
MVMMRVKMMKMAALKKMKAASRLLLNGNFRILLVTFPCILFD